MKKTFALTLLTLAGLAFGTSDAQAQACAQFCESQRSPFIARCEAEDLDPGYCAGEAEMAVGFCFERQCSLEVEVPDLEGLLPIAEAVAQDRLGSGFVLSDVQLHCYSTENCDPSHGSWVFSLVDPETGSEAFLEMGASLYLEPVLTLGIETLPAADVLRDDIAYDLEVEYGGGPFELQRRFLSGAYPILEFSDGISTYFYAVGTHMAETEFEIVADPDADPEREALRLEANKARWQELLETYGG